MATVSKNSKPGTTVPESKIATPVADVTPAFIINRSAMRKTISMVIHSLLMAFDPEVFFGKKFTAADKAYFTDIVHDRANRILGKRPLDAVQSPDAILEMALTISPNSGGAKGARSEVASKRKAFLEVLRSKKTVAEIEAVAASWPDMPETIADTVLHRKSIAKRAADRAAKKAAKAAAAAAPSPRTTKTPKAPAPAPVAPSTTKRPVVAKIEDAVS